MKRTRLRSGLLTGALCLFTAVAFLYLAPTRIGGSTSYIITRGISMEPRFHTGDLALVRPADRYHVGEIVAYHSSALRVVVLHRIIALDGDRYVFKGDNNNFVDPIHPDRAELVGVLWVHIPHAGRVLALLHTPLAAGVVTAVVALLLLFGVKENHRRRNHRRNGATGSGRQGTPPVNPLDHGAGRHINFRAPVIACAAALAAFLILGLIAFTRPLNKPAKVTVPYTQRVSFGYRTSAPAGPVYPGGVVNTGDPIFLQLVHRVRVQIDYRLATAAAHRVVGTEKVLLQLTGPGGWSHSIQLAPPRAFTGDASSIQVTLDLPHLQSVIGRIERLTGFSAGGGYSFAVVPELHISGTLAGQPIDANFDPVLSFQLGALQLTAGSGATPPAGTQVGGLSPSQTATVARASTTPNSLSVGGHALAIPAIRWVAVIGFVLAVVGALVLAVRLKLSRPFDETARIQSQYGHLIVPIAGGIDEMWTPFDVTNIKALVRLAECGQRLILHHHDESADTYLVDDEGTMYRYKAAPAGVVWGEWSSTAPEPIVGVPAPDGSSSSPADAPGDAPAAEPAEQTTAEPDDEPVEPDDARRARSRAGDRRG